MIPFLTLAHAASPEADIDRVLDDLHRAASEADAAAYFGRFTDDAVFIGTDPTERWTIEEFRLWAAPRFEGESAWTYVPVERHVSIAPKGRVAWFDEMLDHARYGRVRGSGALVRMGKEWKVSQYVLSFAVPNDVAPHTIQATKGEAMLPTPFTAAQIREAMPVGAFFEHESQGPDDDAPQRTTWEVVKADEQGCTIAYGGEGAKQEKAHTWEELRDHARFPAPFTTVTDERIDTALGPLDCRRYTVQSPESEPGPTRHFWFCPAMPGAPVRMHTVQDDKVIARFELVARR
ncbi:MAG: nuclear transport factor 2 family protein [Myxococcota bacterium]